MRGMWTTLTEDAIAALRHLRHTSTSMAIAVLALALGLGTNLAVFTVLHTLTASQLPIPRPTELMAIKTFNGKGVSRFIPINIVDQLSADSPIESPCAYNGGFNLAVEANGRPSPVQAAYVTGGCFGAFGVQPLLGRLIDSKDAPSMSPGEHVAVISHRLWMSAFNSDHSAIGKVVHAEGIELTVIGVLPPGFFGLQRDFGIDLFAPFDTVVPAPKTRRPVASEILGRLRKDVTAQSAQAWLDTNWPDLIKSVTPTSMTPDAGVELFGDRTRITSIATGLSDFRERYSDPIKIVLAFTLILLAMTCINVGGVMLVQATARTREIRVRFALGATRYRVAQQMLLESLTITVIAMLLALPVALLAIRALANVLPRANVDIAMQFQPDLTVLVMMAAVTLLVGATTSLLPHLVFVRSTADGGSLTSKQPAGFARRAFQPIVVAQVALSITALVGAGLLLRSLYMLQNLSMGIDAKSVTYVRVLPLPGGYANIQSEPYYAQLTERLTAIPGVTSVGFSRFFPRAVVDSRPAPVSLVGEDIPNAVATTEVVSSGFFEAVGISLVHGRKLSAMDNTAGEHVAVINRALARTLNEDDSRVVGRRLRIGNDSEQLTIVGVVSDATLGNPRSVHLPIVYRSALQMGNRFTMSNLVLVGPPSTAIAAAVRDAVNVGGREHVHEVAPLADVLEAAPVSERLSARVAGTVGFMAALIAALGIYATLNFSVITGTREIGVRLAIGAQPREAASAVLRRGLQFVFVGLVLGLTLSWFTARYLESLLFGISGHDVWVYAVAAAAAVGFATIASVAPARRAAAVDPVVALRTE